MDPYIGQIFLVAWNFVPRGFAACDGRLLTIREYNALFALLGTTYGGDGVTTFALPDLRGRVPVGAGTAPGIPAVEMGQAAIPSPAALGPEGATTATATPTLGLNYVIALSGVFPSRD